MDKISERMNNFFESKWSMIIFSIIGFFIAILELSLFFGGIIEINGISLSNTADISFFQKWFTFFVVVIALVSLVLGFLSSVLNTRNSKYAWLIALVSLLISLFLDLMAGLWMVVIEYSIAIVLVLFRKGFWLRQSYKEEKYQLKNMWWLLIVVAIVMSLIFFGIVGFFGKEVYSWHFPGMEAPNKGKEWVWWFDAITAVLGVLGAVSLFFRWRIAFVFWSIVIIPIIPIFFINGNYIQIFQMILWFIIDFGVALAMTHQQKEYVSKEKV